MKIWTVLAATSVLALCGCRSRLANFTVYSSRNVDLSRMGEYQRTGVRVQGEVSRGSFLFFPIGRRELSADDALEDAIDGVPAGVMLVDGNIDYVYGGVIVFSTEKLVVEGEVVVDPAMTTPEILSRQLEALRQEQAARAAPKPSKIGSTSRGKR